MTYLKLNDISAYKKSYFLSNYVWNIVLKWDNFSRNTIGSQFTRAIDSISSNIAEGFGRYFVKDKVNFYRFSRGSVMESLDWNEKAYKRKLLTKEEYQYILKELQNLPMEINQLIRYTKSKLKE